MTDEEFDDVVRVHLRGHFSVYRAAAAVMRKQEEGGSLLGSRQVLSLLQLLSQIIQLQKEASSPSRKVRLLP